MESLEERIKRHEGYRALPYRDSLGFWTIGYGHLIQHLPLGGPVVTVGVLLTILCDSYQHEKWFVEDLAAAHQRASKWIPSYSALSQLRQEVLVEMCFQLGGRVYEFRRFMAAVAAQDWPRAAIEMKDSRWYHQTKSRVDELVELLLAG